MDHSEHRKKMLAETISRQVAKGRRIESQSDYQAVLASGKNVNHILHLLLSFFTLGMWAVIWLLMVLTGGVKREMVQVDEAGYSPSPRL